MAYSVNTSNRLTGFASGIDTESMVKELMAAERIPLDNMTQDLTWKTWQRDAYREMNTLLSELDNQLLNMKLQKTYSSKATSSTDSSAVTATATAGATSSSYSIQVDQLATSAINVSANSISGSTKIDPNGKLSEQDFAGNNITADGSFDVSYFNEAGEEVTKTISYTADDSLNSVLKKIGSETGNELRATYDTQSDKIVIERTKTGDFNTAGNEIGISGDFFSSTMQMTGTESGGTDAVFKYNGVEFTSKQNSYKLNDVTFNFTNVTTNPVTVTVTDDVDAAYENIKGFVDKYNEIIEKVNSRLNEDRYRNYDPLTDEQKDEMSESEIELWQEKSQSGLLKNDSLLENGLWSMRRDMYSTVETNGSYNHLTAIGIDTSSDFSKNGKLEINEKKLKEALQEDPESVYKLFSNDVEGEGKGIINRLEDSIETTISNIEKRAGKTGATLETYTLGRQMDDMEDRISAFEDRLVNIEDRYWSQFTAMEKMISQMNSQASYLTQAFS
ncbi:flagellar hook-associated protein 2 [Gracilibacillus caseinilyticus]|uniref:Flagellar hook-associated protein 2 n=1 Tax=Gracilibacillus caseinilyticus TaxID=2932256 RepID=A0ABY4EV62_9BACI|nr:flagellar hook-associated protein 2 [Gracilibacillus caseinilyticus]UOQ48294.1 flagellar hook-associated protein 2 [Gracilibacillus caseinilyticus]